MYAGIIDSLLKIPEIKIEKKGNASCLRYCTAYEEKNYDDELV